MRFFHFTGSAVLLLACLAVQGQEPARDQGGDSYLAKRAAFHTTLLKKGPSPQAWSDDAPPGRVSKVIYESAGRQLKSWLFRPPSSQEQKRPALVYLHGGFAFGESDLRDCLPFAEAGFFVMCPTFRGENGNAGDFELMHGEVDDAAAAIRWLAVQQGVDAGKIYVFGHSSGGVMSAMLTLHDKLPIRHTGSAGGLYGPDLFAHMADMVPFDLQDANERQMRVVVGNIRWMKRPHYAFTGDGDVLMRKQEAEQEAAKSQAPLKVCQLAGDHHSTLAPAMRAYLKIVLEDR